ncbi:exosortase system-associated protein, TIGR04073 family [Verrucomicrobia bacterium]|nr:exosortase system-associated protein, TIGR04073 family [Verrucomicrobiota bacterium]
MRRSFFATILALTATFLMTGCSGPSYKLGRGINNLGEIIRLGELRRSIEQAGLWEGDHHAFTSGAIRGFNRTIARSLIGVAEIATFPVPSYDPWYKRDGFAYNGDTFIGGPYRKDHIWSLDFMTEAPRYPDSYHPGPISDSIFATDTALGFAAGEVVPFVPGSRFHIFDF